MTRDLKTLLQETAARHHQRLCPRQVLGVRVGMYAGEMFHLDLPQGDKRLLALVETDGCFTDGIAVSTGCWWGRRTMRLMDYGKVAATFVDTRTGRALRIRPALDARVRALEYVSDAPDRWHAQLYGYQSMPNCELLEVCEVELAGGLDALIGQAGTRVVCQTCGEEILNRREIQRAEKVLCRACDTNAYYVSKK